MRLLLPAAAFALLFGCGHARHHPAQVVRAVYHWRNDDNMYESEEQFIPRHGVKLLLWKVLDIDWNEANQAHPVSIVRSPFVKNAWGFGDESGKPWAQGVELVPVVFITDRTMLHCDSTQLPVFADKLTRKLIQLCGQDWRELQLDCDWSARTKDHFFALVRTMRERLHRRVSVTVRLHQFKDPEHTGVPPADRGMLMLYNVEDVRHPGPQNSIFNAKAARPYFKGAGVYPLPLDVALPAYSWLVHYRKGRFLELEDDDQMNGLDSTWFQQRPDGTVQVVHETDAWWGDDLHIGDELKWERADSTVIRQAVEMAATATNDDTLRVAFFDLPRTPRPGITDTIYEQAWEALR